MAARNKKQIHSEFIDVPKQKCLHWNKIGVLNENCRRCAHELLKTNKLCK